VRATNQSVSGNLLYSIGFTATDTNSGESLQARAPAPVTASATASPVGNNSYAAAAALASTGMQPEEIAQRCGLAAGEARLLASLAAARLGRRAEA